MAGQAGRTAGPPTDVPSLVIVTFAVIRKARGHSSPALTEEVVAIERSPGSSLTCLQKPQGFPGMKPLTDAAQAELVPVRSDPAPQPPPGITGITGTVWGLVSALLGPAPGCPAEWEAEQLSLLATRNSGWQGTSTGFTTG